MNVKRHHPLFLDLSDFTRDVEMAHEVIEWKKFNHVSKEEINQWLDDLFWLENERIKCEDAILDLPMDFFGQV